MCQNCSGVLSGSQKLYCSVACQQETAQKAKVAEWLRTGQAIVRGDPNHYVKRHIMTEQGGVCAICSSPPEWQGKPLSFILDHVNGRANDNRRENLRLVCPNCDSQLDTYKSRNRGNGTRGRR